MNCPICDAPAQNIAAFDDDFDRIKCSKHETFDVSHTLKAIMSVASGQNWQTLWERGKATAGPGEIPRLPNPEDPLPLECGKRSEKEPCP